MPALNSTGRLGLVLHPRTDPTPVAEKLERWARSHDKRVIADERHAARLPAGIEPVSAEQLVELADALISLGGDGTMLGRPATRRAPPVPVLGVNLGHLDFLIEIEPHEIDAALDRLDTRAFTSTARRCSRTDPTRRSPSTTSPSPACRARAPCRRC